MEACELIVDGFVRSIEILLNKNDENQIIPTSIIAICLQYYYCQTLIFCLSSSVLRIADLDNKTKRYKCAVSTINNNNNNNNNNDEIEDIPQYINHCYDVIENIPNKVAQSLYIKYNEYYSKQEIFRLNKKYHAVFRCSHFSLDSIMRGSMGKCYAILIDPKQFGILPQIDQQNEMNWKIDRYHIFDNNTIINAENIFGYKWNLPSISVCNNYCVYSKQYGLLSIGGNESNLFGGTNNVLSVNKIYGLDLKYANYLGWKHIMNMKKQRENTSAIIIGDNKLFIVGGYNPKNRYLNCCEIIDLSTKQFIHGICNIYQYRKCGGIHYNETKHRVFICGGYNALNKAEIYDVIKNKWYRLPVMRTEHRYYPSVFTINNELLYCASMSSGYLECIDLRINNKKWQCYKDLTLLFGDDKRTVLIA